jgi:hypothetical protein
MNKLAELGVIISTDRDGNPQIQRIDNAEEFAIEHNMEYVKQLESDADAKEVVEELVIDNYIEMIRQDLLQGDSDLLYSLLKGTGCVPIHELSEQDLIVDAKELGII